MSEGVLSESCRSRTVEVSVICPGCRGTGGQVFFDMGPVPVHCNILWSTAESARDAVRGVMRLASCPDCGLLFNAEFNPTLVTYDEAYENSLHYSPRFQAYAEALARDLSARFHLRGHLVVEVGCGKGDFLRRLCTIAGARGLGIDASYDPSIASDADDHGAVRFVKEPFSSLTEDLQPALVFCRHVLEHLADPRPFVGELVAAARRSQGCQVFVEVPNALFTLRDLGIWDLIYEHHTYFSAPALSRLCERSGLHVNRVYSAFGDQFLCLEAIPGVAASRPRFADDLREIAALTARFAEQYRTKVDYWASRLRELKAGGRTVAVWGAGSKGITFVNVVPGGHGVACMVDLNPRKQGRYVPGTGQPIVAPEALRQLRPDVIIVMNPLYRDEVSEMARQVEVHSTIEVA